MGILPRISKPAVIHTIDKSVVSTLVTDSTIILVGNDFVAGCSLPSLETKWHFAFPGQGVFREPLYVVVGDRVVLGYPVGKNEDLAWLYCVDLHSGQLRWHQSVPYEAALNQTEHCLCSNRLILQLRSPGRLLAIDTVSGDVAWQTELEESYSHLCGHTQSDMLIATRKEQIARLDSVSGNVLDERKAAGYVGAILLDKRELWYVAYKADTQESILCHERVNGQHTVSTKLPGDLSYPNFRSWKQAGAMVWSSDWGIGICERPGAPLSWHYQPEYELTSPVELGDKIMVSVFGDGFPVLSGRTGELMFKVDVEMEGHYLQWPNLPMGKGSVYFSNLSLGQGPKGIVLSLVGRRIDVSPVDLSTAKEVKDLFAVREPKKKQRKAQVKGLFDHLYVTRDWEEFASGLSVVFGLDQVHSDVIALCQDAIDRTAPMKGPVGILPLRRMAHSFLTFRELFSVGSDQLLAPCLFLGNADGVYFYVHLESGRIFFRHHDSIAEVAMDLEDRIDGEDHSDFLQQIFTDYSLFSLAEFRRFEAALGEYRSDELCEMELEEPEKFFNVLKDASGWSYGEMEDIVYGWLEYLTYSDDGRPVLQRLASDT